MNQREINCRGRRFFVGADRHTRFWDLFVSESWEPETLDMLERHLDYGSQFVDIGSWIGPLALFAAASGSHVLAFEPDPVARQDFQDNTALNPALESLITIDPRAVGSQDRTLLITGGKEGLGKSGSRVVSSDSLEPSLAPVDVVDVRTLVDTDAFRNCQLLKCDIEGGEYHVIPRLRRYFRDVGPPLLISLHGYDLFERRTRMPRRAQRGWLRAVQGARRLRLIRALAPYEYVYWCPSTRKSWKPLVRSERAALVVRFGESELYCAHTSI